VSGHRIVSIQTTEERGGAEYANVDLLRALGERGHDVVLLTNIPEIAANTGVRVRRIETGPKLGRASVVRVALQAPRTLVRLARALHAERPVGSVLLHFKKEQLLCSLLPRRLTGEIVWAEWGPVPVPMRRGLARWLYALASRRAKYIVAVSEGTRRSVAATGVPAAKLKVIPNLVDVERVSFDPDGRERLRRAWGTDERTMVVGCVSRLQRRKRNDVAIDAMAHMNGDVQLVVAGEGEEEAALRERAAPFGDRVRFVANVRGEVEAFLSACDLLVFAPSPTEGEPRIVVLAQLVGLPVIATHPEGVVGLIPEGGGTIVSPAHDPHALAAAIGEYRDDRARGRREGEVGRAAMLASHDRERTLHSFKSALGLERAATATMQGANHANGSYAGGEEKEEGRPLKIVSVMTTDSSGGAEFAAVEMLDALQQRGHETVMLSDMPGIARDTGVRVVDLDTGPKLSTRTWTALASRWPLLLRRFSRALDEQMPYDVLMVHYKKEQLMAGMLPRRLRATTVWAEWGPVPLPLRRGIPRRAYLHAAKLASLVMAVSEGTRTSVRDVGVNTRLVVVPNVMREDEIRYTEQGRARVRDELGIPADAFVVGCVSRFHRKKRNDVVIEAVRELEDPRVHLILAGDGETESELRELARGLGERAHFIATPGSEIPDVLSAFDISVFCPSPTEGAPRAVILGMLASRPCLSTGAEGVADMISEEFGGIASPENSPAALTALLRPYLDDPERVEREGSAARAYAERTYAAPVVAEMIEQLLREAIASPRGVPATSGAPA
jgi:glycosyltransferase involved in cell wall biosynthesis